MTQIAFLTPLGARHVLFESRLEAALKTPIAVIDLASLARPGTTLLPLVDLGIINLVNPSTDARAVVAQLRRDPSWTSTPLIAIVRSTEQAPVELLEQGINDFIEQGASPEVFIARIRIQLRHLQTVREVASLASRRDHFASLIVAAIRSTDTAVATACQQLLPLVGSAGGLPTTGNALKDALTWYDFLNSQAQWCGDFAATVIESLRDPAATTPRVVDYGVLLQEAYQSRAQAIEGFGTQVELRLPQEASMVQGNPVLLKLLALMTVQSSGEFALFFAQQEIQLQATLVQSRPAWAVCVGSVGDGSQDLAVFASRRELFRSLLAMLGHGAAVTEGNHLTLLDYSIFSAAGLR